MEEKEYKGAAPRIQGRVDKKFKYIVDEFLKEKQMSQTELINNYIPAVLIAIDEKLYWELYKQIYDNENVKQEVEKIRGGKMGEG
ncbi:MAG: hypothetical protein KBA50_09400 [Sedimentibacter sp.]|jgi:hypothetical protein|nr:hypothetical protein [Sedimentibacter sp.]